jgi:hypothetical protein
VSDTPETDKQSWWSHSAGKIELCPAEFARKLERERDTARFDLEFRRELYAVQELQLAKAQKTILELQKK